MGGRYVMSRRAAIAGAGLVAGCEHTWPDLPLPADGVLRRRISDGHVHLFNAADLPVRGFIKHVFVRDKLKDLPDVGVALIDFFARELKSLSMSADDELKALDAKQRLREFTPDEFGAVAKRAVATRVQGQVLGEDIPLAERVTDEQLERGYNQLSAILALRYEPLSVRAFLGGESDQREDRRQDVFAATARDAYRGSENMETELRANLLTLPLTIQSQDVDLFGIDASSGLELFSKIINTVKWGYVMLQPRSAHLNRYLRTYGGPTLQPYTIANLLVDYDLWLDDTPNPGSDHNKQIAFWARAKEHYGPAIDVRTFASFCPLKQAISALQPNATTHLDELKQHHEAGDIAGVKLYPPMGFRAFSNTGESFDAGDEKLSIGNKVVLRWNAACTSAPNPPQLGAGIDRALGDLYDWCASEGIPILAHSGGTMTPAEVFKTRPHPKYWRAALEASPARRQMRVTFGHFVHDAELFTLAMEGSPKNDEPIWALERDGVPGLLSDPQFPNLFVDLAYTEELLGPQAQSADLPRRFFAALKTYCTVGYGRMFGPVDPGFDRFLYGSDWIMLGQEGAHPSYLRIIRDAMHDALWAPEHIEKVCETNAQRWLGPRT